MILSGLILAAVMVLVLVRPRGLGVAWPALGGAAACLALALVKPADALAVLAMTWNAGLALVGLLVLSAVLEANGAFRAAAHRIARVSGGDGRKLFLGLCALTAAATTLLANDGAILILTPIVAELATLLALPAAGAMAYLFAVGFLCDALSTLLPPSNLTNLLLADALHLTPGAFFLRMLAPTIAALIASTASLALLFRNALPRRFEAAALGDPPCFSSRSARATFTALGTLLVGYGAASLAGVPLGIVVAAVAAALLAWERRGGTVRTRVVLRKLPWSIVLFAAAIFVVVKAVGEHGAQAALARALEHAGDRPMVVGAGVGLLASAVNNLPALLSSVLALKAQAAPATVSLAALLGANIGCKLTPFGSLCTLLWLEVLARHDRKMGWARYLALAVFPTVATLAAALAALALTQRFD